MVLFIAQLPFSAKFFSPPPKKPSTREREYLRANEVKAMIRAAKKVGRHGVRDGAIILLMRSPLDVFSPFFDIGSRNNCLNLWVIIAMKIDVNDWSKTVKFMDMSPLRPVIAKG